tara:strand:- start:912 stop:2072 length:1161 start_codon:yes stop_codon:yes gene_type:complete
MKLKTKLTKIGRNHKKNKGYINPPIYKGSSIIFDDFYSYILDRERDDASFARYGIQHNPTAENFEKALTSLYGANDTVTTNSGLTALIIPFLTFLKNGDHVLINDTLYGPTRIFCEKILKNFGIQIDYFHPVKNIKSIEKKIKKNTKLIFLESPGTATFDIIDFPKITKIAKKENIITVADNTWASPVFCNPLKLGVNIIVEAATKYINGHSDILLGLIASDKHTSQKIRFYTKALGICAGSEELYLAMRGLPTLEIRIKEIEKNALNLARKLINHKKVKKIFHPALNSHKNHNIWKRDFTGSSGLFSFELKKKYSNKSLEKFYKKLKIFKIAYSWGGYESLITFPTIKERKYKENISGTIVRVYCGHENSDDQINDILNALTILR